MSEVQVKSTPQFKLKARSGKNIVIIDMKKHFDFIPDRLIVEQVIGAKNTFVVRAILTEEEIRKENIQKSLLVANK